MSMNAIKQTHRSQEGSVLIGVACFLFLAVGLVLTILSLGSNHRKVSVEQVSMEQAMYVAEAGLERGARYMESNVVTITSSSATNTYGSGTLGLGTYAFMITRSNSSTYNLVSTGVVNGVQRTVSLMRVYQPTYAEFSLWSSNNASLYFKAGEVFNGHVHSDGQLYFDNSGGGPIFHSYLTSKASSYVGSISDIEMDMGLTLNSSQGTMADVDFNSSASDSLKSVATSSGLVLDGNTTITLNNGTLSIINYRKYGNNTAHSYTLPTTENIVYIKDSNTGTTSTKAGTVYLTGGSVNGRLTIATESDIHIQGNIRYASDPVAHPTSDDALGLISRSDVWVDTSAPDNLVIDAAIMATGQATGVDGSFSVDNYDDHTSPVQGDRGLLIVYGGIVQLIRGPVGQFNQSTGATTHGYSKNYSYDPRFINNPPPYYPTIKDQVRFSQWKEGH